MHAERLVDPEVPLEDGGADRSVLRLLALGVGVATGDNKWS